MYTEFTNKNFFEQHTLAAVSLVCRRHARQKVSILECNLTGRFEEPSSITLPVRSQVGESFTLRQAVLKVSQH